MERITRVLSIICLMVTQLTGVSAYNSDIVGIAVAGCISFFFLSVVIAIIVVSFQWTDWYNRWMRQKGKVKMPKAYFKKKEEAKKRLLASSAASHTSEVVNGQLPAQSIDRASWVQGWHQRTNGFANKIYEEKDVTMELGEEDNDEYRIETVLVDNEVLDVGPFKGDHSKEVPVKGDVYKEPYIYSTVDMAKKSSVRGDNSVINAEEVITTTTVVTSEETHINTADSLVYL